MGYLEVQAFVCKVKISESLAVRFAVYYVLNPMISKKLMKNCDKVVSFIHVK